MELWIRSQDRELLLKVNEIHLHFEEDNNVTIWSDNQYLGLYEAEKRALEVLDDIQGYLIPKLHHVCDKDLEGNDVKVLGIDSIQTMVYEMPKE